LLFDLLYLLVNDVFNWNIDNRFAIVDVTVSLYVDSQLFTITNSLYLTA